MPIVHGSQYYRPPEPFPEAGEQDLARRRRALRQAFTLDGEGVALRQRAETFVLAVSLPRGLAVIEVA